MKACATPIQTVATIRIIIAYRFVVHTIAREVNEAQTIVKINIFIFSNLLIRTAIKRNPNENTTPAIAIITNDVVSTFSTQIDSSKSDAL